jgi:hypothetical protein
MRLRFQLRVDELMHRGVLWLGLMLAWALSPGIGKRDVEALDDQSD